MVLLVAPGHERRGVRLLMLGTPAGGNTKYTDVGNAGELRDALSHVHVRHREGAVTIDFDQFLAVDMRVGRIVEVEDFPEARKPAWKLRIDFGDEIGVKRSSAQITNYAREELEGRLVVAVVNFPPRQIGPVRSEVLDARRGGRRGPGDPAGAGLRRAARVAHPLVVGTPHCPGERPAG